MTLVFQGSTTVSGSPTLRNGCTYETGNEALIIDSANNRLRRFSLSTFTELACTTVVSFPAGVALINASSAIVTSYSSSTVDFYELSSNTRTNVSGGIVGSNFAQCVAGDTSTETVLYVGNSTTVGRVRASGYAVASITPRTSSSGRGYRCIITKGADRWLIGCTGGCIMEIDSNGTVYGQMDVTLLENSGLSDVAGFSNLNSLDITTLHYDNNLVTASTSSGNFFIVDWTTKEIISRHQFAPDSSSYPPVLCNASSGIAVTSFGAMISNPGVCIQELDLSVKAPRVRSNLYTAVPSNGFLGIGVNTQNGRGWGIQSNSGPLRFFDVQADRATTTRTFTVQISGVDQKARLILLDETSGTASGRPVLDTIMQSPATYRVPTGKNIIEIVKVGEGVTSLWQVNRYST